jgi:hypothetical protein
MGTFGRYMGTFGRYMGTFGRYMGTFGRYMGTFARYMGTFGRYMGIVLSSVCFPSRYGRATLPLSVGDSFFYGGNVVAGFTFISLFIYQSMRENIGSCEKT